MQRAIRLALAVLTAGGSAAFAAPPLPTVPEGFEVEIAAQSPVVERPVMACFDERGRLFLVDSAGVNEPFEKLLQDPPHRIVVIEDTDGDGRFDKRTVFAEKLVMPQGVLPYRGAVYTASPPSVWKLEDTDGDGVCDKRTEIVTEFGSNGNGADIHGPFLGPDGWLYLCDGRHGHKVKLASGSIDQGLAGGIFRFRTDGSGFQRVCGGGFDNPVEVVFTEEGEMLGTVNILHGNPRQDCLVHWVAGGVYPRTDQEQCLAEFKRTGDLLPPIKEFGHVAVSGLTRYQSEGFGAEFRNNLFITFFNRHKVIRSILERSGSTYTSREEEFLSSEDKDFHPTDVLEDADGTLLVINTGGWFRIGCPVSEIAKPDVPGAIYRIRKKGMKRVDDPRGLALNLEAKPAAEIAPFLDDPRPAVRERAIELMAGAELGPAIRELHRLLIRDRDRTSVEGRRNAVWSLARISMEKFAAETQAPARRKGSERRSEIFENTVSLVEAALHDADEGVRFASASAHDEFNDIMPDRTSLRELVADGPPAVRRAAAAAIGRVTSAVSRRTKQDSDLAWIAKGRIGAQISAVFDSIRHGTGDRFLEHALIYALIEINDRTQTMPFLEDLNPQVRRAALIALDQMPDGRLTRELVTPLLDTDDPPLRKAAMSVIASRKGWATELVELLRGWLAEQNPPDEHLSLLRGVLLAQIEDKSIQQLIGEALASNQSCETVRLLLWEVVLRAPLNEFPIEWLSATERALTVGTPAEIQQVVAVVNSRNLSQFDGPLAAVAGDPHANLDVRIAALATVATRLESLVAARFALLMENIKPETPPLLLLAAARGLADAPLAIEQLQELTQSLPRAGPLALPILIRAFAKTTDASVGMAFVAALEKAQATDNLSAEELAGILRKYPEVVQAQAASLLARLGGSSLEQQKSRLLELSGLLEPPGNARQGRDVFFGRKAACSSCHTIAGEGGRVGPDLSKIGSSRSGTDLLEAIIFPSATFAREFRPYVIATDTGKIYTGIISRQTADAVHLRTADLAEIRVARASIEEMKESNTSIMPKGLETTLTRQELRDLLAFLLQLK